MASTLYYSILKLMITRVMLLLILLGAFLNLEACSVCFSAKDGTRYAYYGTTVLLSLVPLFMVGFFIRWAYKRAKALEEESQLS